MRSVLSHELEHSRNRNCRKVASLTMAIVIAGVMTGFIRLIKFLGNKLLCGHVQDPFPRCRIGSGHARLSSSLGRRPGNEINILKYVILQYLGLEHALYPVT